MNLSNLKINLKFKNQWKANIAIKIVLTEEVLILKSKLVYRINETVSLVKGILEKEEVKQVLNKIKDHRVNIPIINLTKLHNWRFKMNTQTLRHQIIELNLDQYLIINLSNKFIDNRLTTTWLTKTTLLIFLILLQQLRSSKILLKLR